MKIMSGSYKHFLDDVFNAVLNEVDRVRDTQEENDRYSNDANVIEIAIGNILHVIETEVRGAISIHSLHEYKANGYGVIKPSPDNPLGR